MRWSCTLQPDTTVYFVHYRALDSSSRHKVFERARRALTIIIHQQHRSALSGVVYPIQHCSICIIQQ
jgi:hypothetical protein